ncbi:SusD/RagB family nutrient-binding outer membrane lipoprotein [Dysgonomonas sp. HDW5B]|uniref:SusD/RagB family nutrient-binding outer membrane lipoprotein n=1 Tax=Dysgonomonas sp. HDW5B TaxID=2714927 RepID=UPI00140D32F6|nr:SusD/RagB family nutrient-binding outer membrane lipoprotein [Dysgonomonas sp. HDW5B]QIK55560.1 SusD/RagB family nutrient-binding outer membrane lipoprotein [Dysgonomonas sp. HDW5B]
MKRIYIIACALLSLLILTPSCNPEDKFLDPEKTTQGNVSTLFTAMLNNQRMRTEYWQVRTIAVEHAGRYSQTFILPNGSKQYHQTEQYVSEYWRDFYTPEYGGPMAMYRQMENVNKSLSQADQDANAVFFAAAKVVLYDYAGTLVDMLGDIPFSEAGSLQLTSVSTPAKFDNQEALYRMMIDDLDAVNTYFKTATTTTVFSKQDILLSGNIAKWRKYGNSIRLRLLIHMSYVDENYAKEKIMAMLNSSDYPLIDGDNNPNYNPSAGDVLNAPLSTNIENLKQALSEGSTQIAPDFMLNKLMLPTKDVRIDVLFDKNGLSEYKGLPINTPSESISSMSSDYSCWDSTTVWQNKNIPGVRMTASEVNFIKAEAQQRWGDPAKAKTAYETAIKQSVSFYYYLNNTASNTSAGGGFRLEVKPSDDIINKFVTERVAYTGSTDARLELIGTQKWLHLGWLQSIETWTEYRRTKYPKLLPFPSAGMEPGYTQPPTRLQYPILETAYNPNYKDVQAKDTRDTKIFWDVK